MPAVKPRQLPVVEKANYSIASLAFAAAANVHERGGGRRKRGSAAVEEASEAART